MLFFITFYGVEEEKSEEMSITTLHGDETGLLKQVEFDESEKNGKVSSVFGSQSRDNGIDRILVWGENEVLLSTANSGISVWNGESITPTGIQHFSGGRIRSLLAEPTQSDRLVLCGSEVSYEAV